MQGGHGRAYTEQMLHYFRKTISFDTPSPENSGKFYLGTLPPGAIPHMALLKVHTAFDDSGFTLIALGTEDDTDALADEDEWDPTSVEGQIAIKPLDWEVRDGHV